VWKKNKNNKKMETNQNHSKSCNSLREFVALRRKLETEKDVRNRQKGGGGEEKVMG